jgi:hypothetical protein
MMPIQERHAIEEYCLGKNSFQLNNLIEEEETEEDGFSLFFHQIFHRFTHSSKEVEKSPISKQNK